MTLLRESLFFVLFFLYLWLRVEPRLLYHGAGAITNFPSFFKGWEFFRQFISRPGGLLEYACAFLAQLFYSNWAGTLVITAQAWLLCASTACLLRACSPLSADRLTWLRFIPPMLLLPIYGRYTYHFTTTTALCAALFFACLYIRITSKKLSHNIKCHSESAAADEESLISRTQTLRSLCHLAAYLILSVALYVLAAGAYIYFALLCTIYELLFHRRYFTACLYLLAAGLIPYMAGVLLFDVSIIDAFSDLLPISWKIISYKSRRRDVEFVYLIYLFLPLSVFLTVFWQGLLRPRLFHDRSQQQKPAKKRRRSLLAVLRQINSRYSTSTVLRYVTGSVVLFGIAAAVAIFSFDAQRKTRFKIDYYASGRMWPQVLKTARSLPEDPIVISAVNRALYHTGRLGYDMCTWPQHPDTLLLCADEHKQAYWNRFDIRLDLGLLNLAENDLIECLEVFGPRPLVLRRLALVNMAKGNLGSAKIYLGALSKTLFDARWADYYLAQLRNDPNLTTDKHIQLLRANMLKDDDLGLFHAKQRVLSALLQSNSRNRMAFEYLAAWHMLTKRLDQLIEHLKQIKDFDYPEIPRLYEEAVLIYMSSTNKLVDLGGRKGSDASLQRMQRFGQTFNRYMQNKTAALRELARDYGDSYYFYYLYGFSGVRP